MTPKIRRWTKELKRRAIHAGIARNGPRQSKAMRLALGVAARAHREKDLLPPSAQTEPKTGVVESQRTGWWQRL